MSDDRRLATVRIVNDIQPIEGSDFIELATIDGWKVVVKKGEMKIGDKVVYMEVDSFLPMLPIYDFLKKNSYRKNYDGTEGYRLRTVKIRGCLSQGLALPLNQLGIDPNVEVGTDLSEQLGIVKFEKPLPVILRGKAKGYFPSFIRKTDQERIQNLTKFFSIFKDTYFEVSIKMDGTSSTNYFNNGVYGFCSRNMEYKDEEVDNIYAQVAKKLCMKEVLTEYGKNIAVQGEIVGEGIQKNREGIKGYELFVFDIFDIDKQCYMSSEERLETMSKLRLIAHNYGVEDIKHVPILYFDYPVFIEHPSMDDLLAFADGPSWNPNNTREGLVFKSMDGKVSFKAINNNYLLKNEE